MSRFQIVFVILACFIVGALGGGAFGALANSLSTLPGAAPAPTPEETGGAQGPAGADGLNGADGTDGAPGTDGADGKPGANGLRGPKGETGEPGAAGADAIDSIFLVSSDTSFGVMARETIQLHETPTLSSADVTWDSSSSTATIQTTGTYRIGYEINGSADDDFSVGTVISGVGTVNVLAGYGGVMGLSGSCIRELPAGTTISNAFLSGSSIEIDHHELTIERIG
ncbi:MAG: collagen-like protein [Salinibacterium sp.]|nr:MAG: collagen-like protein [Salinibacterium sp.]